MNSPDPTRSSSGRGRCIITSSRAIEYAFEEQESSGQASSIFTAALIQGLATGAADANNDGWISANELYAYISEKVMAQGARQTPQMLFEGEGELFLAKAGQRIASSATAPTINSASQTTQHPTSSYTAPNQTSLSPDVIAGYSPDNPDVADQLGFARHIEALATLIAYRESTPPMSIGLFGGWGTGKSFFMRQLSSRIDQIARSARNYKVRNESAGPYSPHIAQVRFNAWHYVDANMWASLATRIFQGIAEYLEEASGSPGDAHRVLLGQLETSQLLLREAEQRQTDAAHALTEADRKVSSIREESGDRSLAELTKEHPEVTEAAQQLVEGGFAEAATSLQEISGAVRDVRSASTTFGRAWTLFANYLSGSVRRRLLLIPALVVLAGILIAIPFFIDGQVIAAWLFPAVSFITAFASAMGRIARRANQIVQAGMELIGADKADEKRALAEAAKGVEEASENLRRIQRELDDLQALDATGVYRFVSERYADPEYAKYMGVVSLIEQDLRALSRLLTASAPGEPIERGGREMRVDRIVLYIDDLDRCPAGTVLQVLQAVHLLLALPLFVVIVGVDSQWLLGALRSEYRAIVKDGQDDGFDHLKFMPLNYLEKIFQIPYWVPTMDAVGYQRLIRSLVGSEQGSSDLMPVSPDERGEPAIAAPADYEEVRDAANWQEVELDRHAVRLEIEAEEVTLLEALSGFVPTPRGAKRLANIYRLMKASNSAAEAEAFRGNGLAPAEFPAAMLLAAVVTGFPDVVQVVFQRLSSTTAPTWAEFIGELASDWGLPSTAESTVGPRPRQQSSERHRMLYALLRATEPLLVPSDTSVYKKWAPRAAQFSFVGGLLHHYIVE